MLTKKEILKYLPKPFNCCVSKSGFTVWIWVDTKKINGRWDKANKLVHNLAKKFKLDEVGAGTAMDTMVRDWEFIDINIEKMMFNEAKDVLKTMKTFFNKYGNHYCQSTKTYDVIEKMRDLIATDEE